MGELTKSILQRQSQLESARSTFDAHWKEVAERILPRQNDFNSSGGTEGDKRTEKIFDSTAVLALDRAASAIESLITPSTQIYHRLDPEDNDLIDDRDVRMYLDRMNDILFSRRYKPKANFASQAHECYVSLMAFGTLGMFIDDAVGIGARYKSIPMVELFISEGHTGAIDYVHRKFPMSVRAAIQKWGEGNLPESITKLKDKEPFRKFDFIHCVRPNEYIKRGKRDFRGMDLSSFYISIEGSHLVSQGGYRIMPYAVSRHVTAPRETYGRSPAMQVLPDVKMVNEMEKTIIRAAHKIVDPPLLIYGDGVLSAFNARPNALNYGGVDEQGRQLVHPLKTGSNLPIALEMTEQKRKVINDAFYITLFQILVENPRMTATEALIRAQEKGQLLAPTVGRQESEFLGAVIDREIDIGMASDAFPPPPQQLLDRGGGIKVTHTSPLSRLRKAEDGVAIMRTIEAANMMAQYKPEVLDIFDDDATIRELAAINGCPVKIMRSADDVAAMRSQREQQQKAAAGTQVADTAANAARNMSVTVKNMNEMGQGGGNVQ